MKNSILEKIFLEKRRRVDLAKSLKSFSEVEKDALARPQKLSFKDALIRKTNAGIEKVSAIAELKKASPSAGLIRENLDVENLAQSLAKSGAVALSIITEEKYFLGSSDYLARAASAVKIPILRKDFIFDEYQIAEARALGASAVLLIAKMLSKKEFLKLYSYSKSLGLDVLAEAHDESEIEMLSECGAEIIGVNSRNLETFKTDFSAFEKNISKIPRGIKRVCESSVSRGKELELLASFGADAALVGSALMSKENPARELEKLLKGNL